MREFFRSLYQSIVNPAWLKEQRKSTGKAFGYALFFVFLVSVVQGFSILWELPGLFQHAITAIEQSTPDFRAHFDNGKLFVEDLEQPYVQTIGEGEEKFKIVVDTTTSTLDVKQYLENDRGTTILLSQRGFVMYDPHGGQTRIQEWRFTNKEEFTKADVLKLAHKFTGLLGYMIGPMIILLFFIFLTIGKLAYLLFISFLAWLFSLISKRGYSFGEIYTVGLFALTTPTLVKLALNLAGIQLPYIYTIILGVYLVLALVYSKDKPMIPPTPTQA